MSGSPIEDLIVRRAPALPLADRREMIVDAVIPLLVEHGREVTSRQIAEAAGVAEGTVFRAFGDKETLLRAAAEKFFDAETVRRGLRAIDPDDPVQVKLAEILRLFRARFAGAMKVMSVLGGERPASNADPAELQRIVAGIFAPDAARLAWNPDRIVHVARLLAFSSAIPDIAAVDTPFTDDELAALITNGVLAAPSSGDPA